MSAGLQGTSKWWIATNRFCTFTPVPILNVEPIKTETLGTVMDNIFNESDLRSSTGGIGLLTKEVVTRIDLTCDAFLMALTPFINDIWKD